MIDFERAKLGILSRIIIYLNRPCRSWSLWSL